MRKKRFIIKPPQSSGRKFNTLFWFVLALILDRFGAPNWMWNIFWVSATVLFIIFIADMVIYEEVHVDIQKILKRAENERESEELIKSFTDEELKNKNANNRSNSSTHVRKS